MDDADMRKTAKSQLQQVYWLDKRIDQDMIRLDQLRKTVVSLGAMDYSKPIVQSSHGNSTEHLIARIVDLQADINREIDALVDLKSRIADQIDQLGNDAYCAVLRYRYICLFRWEDIEARMNYSHGHVMRIHKRALQAYGEKMRLNETSACSTMVL